MAWEYNQGTGVLTHNGVFLPRDIAVLGRAKITRQWSEKEVRDQSLKGIIKLQGHGIR